MAKVMSKSELIHKIAEQHSSKLTRKDVKGVIESLAKIGYMELKKSGFFLIPGFAKFVVIKKPATKERSGINPFTKEPTIFKAKPARKIVRARPVKAVKDAGIVARLMIARILALRVALHHLAAREFDPAQQRHGNPVLEREGQRGTLPTERRNIVMRDGGLGAGFCWRYWQRPRSRCAQPREQKWRRTRQ